VDYFNFLIFHHLKLCKGEKRVSSSSGFEREKLSFEAEKCEESCKQRVLIEAGTVNGFSALTAAERFPFRSTRPRFGR
jgi:hypothetical protein